jgi:tetratricopeptide (TPR) repeat protein
MRSVKLLPGCVLAVWVPVAFANGGGSMSTPSMSMPRQQTPQQLARDAYNDGVHYVKKADKAQEYALQATDAGKKEKAKHEAQETYAAANARFRQSLGADDSVPEAWNYLGYSSRKLGNYDDALAAYAKALTLRPGYPDALEYRGEAYLVLNRVTDAQQSPDLYASNAPSAAADGDEGLVERANGANADGLVSSTSGSRSANKSQRRPRR